MSDFHLLMVPLDPQRGSWDRAEAWRLAEGGVLAFVADAPEAAQPRTAKWIQAFLAEARPRIERLLALLPDEEVPVLLADLATQAGDHLLEQGSGGAYAACVLALCRPGRLWVLPVGDCALYALPDGGPARRVSDSTRVAGGSFPEPGGRLRPTHYAEGVYLGAASRRFLPSEVVAVPLERDALVVLVSDGAEDQLGVPALLTAFQEHPDPAALERRLRPELEGARRGDDVTLLAFRAAGRERSAEVAELRRELAAAVTTGTAMHQEVNALKHQVASLGAALSRAEQARDRGQTELGELRRRMAGLEGGRTLWNQEPNLLKLEEQQRSILQTLAGHERRFIDLQHAEDACQEGIGCAPGDAPLLEPKPAGVPGTARSVNVPLAASRAEGWQKVLGLLKRLRRPPWPAAWSWRLWRGWRPGRRGVVGVVALALLAALAVAAYQRVRPERMEDGGSLGEPRWDEPTAPAAPAAEREALFVVYLPPGADAFSGTEQQVSSADEVKALLGTLGTSLVAPSPGPRIVVPLALARERWADLRQLRWGRYEVQRGDTWLGIAARHVAPLDELRRANPTVERGAREVPNPGENLQAGDVLRVPTLHLRAVETAAGPTLLERVAALGLSWRELDRSWQRGRTPDGRAIVLLPLGNGELPPAEIGYAVGDGTAAQRGID